VETIEHNPTEPKEIPLPKKKLILRDVSISGSNGGTVKYMLKEHAMTRANLHYRKYYLIIYRFSADSP
jgi:hypothetical protein